MSSRNFGTISIFYGEAQDFLKEPICLKERIHQHYIDFIGERIPPLILPSCKEEWDRKSTEKRKKLLDEVFLKNVPKEWINKSSKVEWLNSVDREGYIIRKLRYECLPSLFIPALLYIPKNLKGKVPVVLNVNGHTGSLGKAIEYKQIRCINEAKRGIIALNLEFIGHGELRLPGYSNHNNLAYLDLCGVSGVSVFYLTLKKGLDLLLGQEHADPQRVAVTGLSGGGWQTIVISSLDVRVTCAIPVAGYIGLLQRLAYNSDIGDLEQVPSDLCLYADYTHLTALLAPRPALLINNKYDDCCFKSYRARPNIYSPIIPFYSLYNKIGSFHFYENTEPGTHNYEQDNRERFYKFLNHEFFNDKDTIDKEITVKNEILTPEEANVGVPKNNQTFNSLARDLLPFLPLNKLPNGDKEKILSWQILSRKKLKNILRFHPAAKIGKELYKTLQVTSHQEKGGLQLSLTQIKYFINEHGGYKEWEVPAVKITTKDLESNKITLIISDKGRQDVVSEIRKYLSSEFTVIVLDILLKGEQLPHLSSSYFRAMLLATVGERALGIAISQLNAIANLNKEKSITLVGKGMVCSIIALLTCSLNHSDNINTAELIGLPVSLKLLIENKIKYEDCPELYCFGLLRYFDIREYIGMAAPINIHISDVMGTQERVEKEFWPLKELFQKWENAEFKLH